MKTLGIEEISAGQVSALAKSLDQGIEAGRPHPRDDLCRSDHLGPAGDLTEPTFRERVRGCLIGGALGGPAQQISIAERVHRSEFEDAIAADLDQIRVTVYDVLAEASLTPEQVDVVMLTGDCQRFPHLSARSRKYSAQSESPREMPSRALCGDLDCAASRSLANLIRSRRLHASQFV